MMDTEGKRMPPLEAARHYLNSEREITFGKVDMRLMIEGLVAMIINLEAQRDETVFTVKNMTNSLQSRIDELSRDVPDTSAERMYDAIIAYNALTDGSEQSEIEIVYQEMIAAANAFVDPPRNAEAVMVDTVESVCTHKPRIAVDTTNDADGHVITTLYTYRCEECGETFPHDDLAFKHWYATHHTTEEQRT